MIKEWTVFVIAAGVLLWGLFGYANAPTANLPWQTDLPRALERAQAERKLVLLDFTGSDWCEPCKLLEETIFGKPEFATYARTNLELVRVDFPIHKPQPADVKAANEALGKKLDVEGFPTLIAMEPDGKVVWRMDGLLEGGPKALIAKLDGAPKP